MDDPAWPARVALKCSELCAKDEKGNQPLRRHSRLKEAIQEVTERMQREELRNSARTAEDKLGCTMKFIRAAEAERLLTMERCVMAYSELVKMADHRNPNLRQFGLEPLRQHAVELARDAITQDLHDIDASQNTLDWQQLQTRKEHVSVRLKRLVPGATVGLTAMADEHGQVTTDPSRMAELLRGHWQAVFSERVIDRALLQRWLGEMIPEVRLSGSAAGLPPSESPLWQVTKAADCYCHRRRGCECAMPRSYTICCLEAAWPSCSGCLV